MRVEVTISDAEVAAAFAELQRRGVEMKPVMDEIGDTLAASARTRMEHGVAPDGAPWLPSRRAIEQGGKTLKDSGTLFRSISHNAYPDRVEVGTGHHLGKDGVSPAIHQFGGTIRPKAAPYLVFRVGDRTIFAKEVTIPARPFLGVSAEDEVEIVRILRDYLAEAGGGAVA